MKYYTKYNPDTGDVVSVFSGTEADAELNRPCIEGRYTHGKYKIIDGQPIEQEIIQPEDTSDYWYAVLRLQRDDLLQKSDWTQVPDAPVDQAAWAVYRQALRDLPENTQDPRNPTWPERPA